MASVEFSGIKLYIGDYGSESKNTDAEEFIFSKLHNRPIYTHLSLSEQNTAIRMASLSLHLLHDWSLETCPESANLGIE